MNRFWFTIIVVAIGLVLGMMANMVIHVEYTDLPCVGMVYRVFYVLDDGNKKIVFHYLNYQPKRIQSFEFPHDGKILETNGPSKFERGEKDPDQLWLNPKDVRKVPPGTFEKFLSQKNAEIWTQVGFATCGIWLFGFFLWPYGLRKKK